MQQITKRLMNWASILEDGPLEQARRWVPMYMFLAGFTITLITLFKGLKHVGIELTSEQSYLVAIGVGIVIAVIGKFFISRIKVDPEADRDFHFATVEKVFGVLMVITACAMAFAHGSNEVANAIGPVAAVISVASTGVVGQQAPVPLWILMLGGAGIVVGLATFGRQVMRTVGENITHLTPSRGFAAELAAATTIVVASGTGLPISTTHTLVGAVLGAWLGAVPIPLDWDREWQKWPVTIVTGMYIGHALGARVVGSLFFGKRMGGPALEEEEEE
jgi:PiT family inorganic phosphate transporter